MPKTPIDSGLDELAFAADRWPRLYHCRCGWSGDEPLVADSAGNSPGPEFIRPYAPGQAHCPACGEPLDRDA